jgi:hypothetical protein
MAGFILSFLIPIPCREAPAKLLYLEKQPRQVAKEQGLDGSSGFRW